MINQVILVGRLGQAPDINYTTNGLAIARLSVATSETFKDNAGNKQERTEWHNVKVFGVQAEHCSKYLAKGQMVFIEGKIQSSKYTDKQGIQRTLFEIIASRVLYLGGNTNGNGNNNAQQQMKYNQAQVEMTEQNQITPEEIDMSIRYRQSQSQASAKGYYQNVLENNTQAMQAQVDAVPF